MTDTDETPTGPQDRRIDMDSLKGLAHPLRVSLLDALSTYGAATASGLAERLGESSGATSYHLRQLAKHGFVREIDGRGSGRERWWERVPGSISLNSWALPDTAAARSASNLVMAEWERNRSKLLNDFLAHGTDDLPKAWLEVTNIATSNLHLTLEQLTDVNARLEAALDSVVDSYRGLRDPGSRPVQLHINLFPVLDGTVVPDDQETTK